MSVLISQKMVRTRKKHQCQACAALFAIGSYVNTTTTVDDGRIGTYYWCDVCMAFMGTMDDDDLEQGFNYDIKENEGYAEFAAAWRVRNEDNPGAN